MRLFRRRDAESQVPAGIAEDRWAHLPDPVPSAPLTGEDLPADTPEHGLVRPVWTEADFAWMGWHDASIWAFDVQQGGCSGADSSDPTHSVTLDLDYITRWVDPKKPDKHFTFWVAPCTLIFPEVTEMELSAYTSDGPYEIADIHAVRGGWHIEGHDGFDLKVAAAGFRQVFRQRPVHVESQRLELPARGGFSYDQAPADL